MDKHSIVPRQSRLRLMQRRIDAESSEEEDWFGWKEVLEDDLGC